MKTSRGTSRSGLFALLLVNFIWAGSFSATSIAMQEMNAVFLTLVRLGTAAVVLAPLLRLPKPLKWHWRTVFLSLVLGFIGFTLPVYLETEGLALSTPAMAAISIALEPLFTVLVAAIMLRESLPIRRRFAVAIALFGAWAIAGFPRPGSPGYLLGDILLILSVLCYGVYNVYAQRLTDLVPHRTAAAATLLGGFATSLPIWLFTGRQVPQHLSHAALASVVYLTLFATAGAYLLWLFALQSFKASVAALFLYLQPVFGVILAMLIIGVHPPVYFYFGSAFILFGIYFGREGRIWPRRRNGGNAASILGEGVPVVETVGRPPL